MDKIDSPFCLQNCFFLLVAHAGLAVLLNNWLDIEDDNLLRHEEVEIALEQEKVQPAIEETIETNLSSSTEMVLPEDSPDPDSEVQPLTRMKALNSVNITEGIEMVKKVLQMMAVLGEDEASHMLTRGYRKCLDREKKHEHKANCTLGLFLFQIWTLHVELIICNRPL